MACIYFHDAPVYRVDEDAYYRERDMFVGESVKDSYKGLSPNKEQLERATERWQQYYYEKYGPWQFNEIVGYVRLHFLGSQVRGEYFGSVKKRCVKTREKVLVYRTHKLAPEHDVPRRATNSEILKVILGYVDDCRRELPRRFIDAEWLHRIGPMVDWNGVMKSGFLGTK